MNSEIIASIIEILSFWTFNSRINWWVNAIGLHLIVSISTCLYLVRQSSAAKRSRNTKMSTQISYFLNFFDIFGFNSEFSQLSKHRKTIFTIYSAHIFLAIVLTLFKFYFMFKYYLSLGLIVAINEFLQYFISLFTYWMIIFDSILQCNAHSLLENLQ